MAMKNYIVKISGVESTLTAFSFANSEEEAIKKVLETGMLLAIDNEIHYEADNFEWDIPYVSGFQMSEEIQDGEKTLNEFIVDYLENDSVSITALPLPFPSVVRTDEAEVYLLGTQREVVDGKIKYLPKYYTNRGDIVEGE